MEPTIQVKPFSELPANADVQLFVGSDMRRYVRWMAGDETDQQPPTVVYDAPGWVWMLYAQALKIVPEPPELTCPTCHTPFEYSIGTRKHMAFLAPAELRAVSFRQQRFEVAVRCKRCEATFYASGKFTLAQMERTLK